MLDLKERLGEGLRRVATSEGKIFVNGLVVFIRVGMHARVRLGASIGVATRRETIGGNNGGVSVLVKNEIVLVVIVVVTVVTSIVHHHF